MPLLRFQCSLRCTYVCVSSLMKRCALTVCFFWNCERVCAGFLERELITAASLPIFCKTTWWASASYTSHPVLLQTASHHLRTLLFSPAAHKLVTKAENTEMAGRQHKFQKNTPWLNERHFCSFLKSLRHLLSWTAKVMLKTMQFEVSFVVCLLKT